MFHWLRRPARCPISDQDRAWVEGRFQWLVDEFGMERLVKSPLILPIPAFFPKVYRGTADDALGLMVRVAGYMNVDPGRLRLHVLRPRDMPTDQSGNVAIGLYEEFEGDFDIAIVESILPDPISVIATLAHEIGHVVLLGQKHVSPDEEDHEPLTDLLTVYLGLGAFTANNVILETQWSLGRQGYLSMDLFGYAFALYAVALGEPQPKWISALRHDVRSAMKKSVRFIRESGRCECRFLHPESND